MSTRDATQDVVTAPVVTSDAEPVSSEAGQTDQKTQGWGKHPVNLRVTILGRYYVAFVAGKEHRTPTRRMEERRKHPLDTLGNKLVLLAIGLGIGLALYGLQLALGMWTLQRFFLAQ